MHIWMILNLNQEDQLIWITKIRFLLISVSLLRSICTPVIQKDAMEPQNIIQVFSFILYHKNIYLYYSSKIFFSLGLLLLISFTFVLVLDSKLIKWPFSEDWLDWFDLLFNFKLHELIFWNTWGTKNRIISNHFISISCLSAVLHISKIHAHSL